METKGAGKTETALFLKRKIGVVKRFSGDLRGALEAYKEIVQIHVQTNTDNTENCANLHMNIWKYAFRIERIR